MGALCAHAAGSKSLYRNMLMRKGNRHIENNDDDDLYIMLMWRLFVCHVLSSSNFFLISSKFSTFVSDHGTYEENAFYKKKGG